jgi:16S rRNA (adenine1518-N6/adenine1519-N6)-dimethyltransferase
VLRQYGIRPHKDLGQSFIHSAEALQRILDAAALGGEETVLEVGPGLGALTLQLCERARRVVAVELDSRLLPPLRSLLSASPSVELHQGDILKIEWGLLGISGQYCVVANIPYSITSALLRKLLESPAPAEWLVLTIQREVAERVIAPPGEMNLLALSVQLYGAARIHARLPAEAFYPQPEVESAVLRIDLHPSPPAGSELIKWIFRLARAGFSQKRKKLRNAISAGMGVRTAQAENWLLAAGIVPDLRAQAIGLEDWLRLAQIVKQGEKGEA